MEGSAAEEQEGLSTTEEEVVSTMGGEHGGCAAGVGSSALEEGEGLAVVEEEEVEAASITSGRPRGTGDAAARRGGEERQCDRNR